MPNVVELDWVLLLSRAPPPPPPPVPPLLPLATPVSVKWRLAASLYGASIIYRADLHAVQLT